MSNIYSTSAKFRDNLLRRNIIVSDYLVKNGYSNPASGVGTSIDIFRIPQSNVKEEDDTKLTSADYRYVNLILNKYLSNNEEYSVDLTNINNSYTKIDGGYKAPTSENESKLGKFAQQRREEILDNSILDGITEFDISSNLKNQKRNKKLSTYSTSLSSDKQDVSKELREKLSNYNQYVELDSQEELDINSLASPINFKNTDKRKNYITYFNSLNKDNFIVNGSDLVGNLLNTGGLTSYQDFDMRNTLAGKVLTGIGVVDDTNLGVKSSRFLAVNFANRISSNLQKETVGRLNLDVESLLNGESLIKSDFNITKPTTGLGITLDYASKILGIQSTLEKMPDDGFMYSKTLKEVRNKSVGYTKNDSKVSNFVQKVLYGTSTLKGSGRSQNDALIKATGSGVALSIYKNLSANIYTPKYENFPNNLKLDDNQYATENSSFDEIIGKEVITLKSKTLEQDSSFLKNNNYDPSWDNLTNNTFGNNANNTQKSLLEKTRDLFSAKYNKNLISRDYLVTDDSKQEIQSSVVVRGGNTYLSRGNNIVSWDGNVPTYCRVWTKDRNYKNVNNLIRHRGLITGTDKQIKNSVLDDNGFVKISPYYKDGKDTDVTFKRYMFSIENLAWADDLNSLPSWEIGNGDPVTGTKGRIMWFPPYDLNFNEGSNASWESTQFIGRSEPVYTYSTVERPVNISFKIVVDHSQIINRFEDDDTLIKFFAGCNIDDLDNILTTDEKTQKEIEEVIIPQNNNGGNTIIKKIKAYFPNEYSGIKDQCQQLFTYEDGNNTPKKTFADDGRIYEDRQDFSLNADFFNFINGGNTELMSFIRDNKNVKIKIWAYASAHGTVSNNLTLSKNRAASIQSLLITKFPDLSDRFLLGVAGKGVSGPSSLAGIAVDAMIAKENRYAEITIEYNPSNNDINNTTENENNKGSLNNENTKNINKDILSRLFNENKYFQKLKDNDPFVFDKITEKIKYFQPGFHSITPQGLNNRLTFLHQCTRQGGTKNLQKKPDNMAFGRPPVCILRIGDFFHTKMIIENLNITYEPLLWDLNPEGIGVQPMLAHVDLSAKLIGGSDLSGPINTLQNALSNNFYANSGIFNSMAETL